MNQETSSSRPIRYLTIAVIALFILQIPHWLGTRLGLAVPPLAAKVVNLEQQVKSTREELNHLEQAVHEANSFDELQSKLADNLKKDLG